MSLLEFDPPLSAPDAVQRTLQARGFAIGSSEWVGGLADASLPTLARFGRTWESLPADPYLRDTGDYRRRRHASFEVEARECRLLPHRAHYQTSYYNALHGGMLRWFEPIRESLVQAPAWSRLLCALGALYGELKPTPRWFVEAHQFRIHTREGIGRPTPEGAHRDGVDFVALFLVARHGIRGGETRVFDATGPTGVRFTLREPWTVLLLDDERIVHESTPILPDPSLPGASSPGYRDTLVLTYRRGGFQQPSEGR